MPDERIEVRPGSASAQADAEAARSVRSEEFITTFKAFAKDESPGAPGPGETVDQPADDAPADKEAAPTDGERSDELPAQKDEPAVSDDYDPEDHVSLGSEDETKAASDAGKDEPRKSWDAYATDEERQRAFQEMLDENAKLKTAPPLDSRKATEPDGKRPPAEEPPRRETLREVAERLTTKDVEVRQFMAGLDRTHEAYKAQAKIYNELTEQGEQIAKDMVSREAVLNHYEAMLKADPENFAAKEQVVNGRQEMLELRTRLNDNAIRRREAQDTGNRFASEVNEGNRTLKAHVESVFESQEAQATKTAADTQATAKAKLDLGENIANAAKHFKIPKEQAERFNRRILEALHVYTDVRGDIPDLKAWMLGPSGQSIAKEAIALQRADTATYVDQKKRDAAQPGPKGKDAIAKPDPQSPDAREGNRRASDAEHKRAAASLQRELAGARAHR